MARNNMNSVEKSILQGLKEVLDYQNGDKKAGVEYTYEVPDEIDVLEIRKKLKMSQKEFTKFGFTLSAIRHWEHKRRKPTGAARVLLKVIENNPMAVLDSLKKTG